MEEWVGFEGKVEDRAPRLKWPRRRFEKGGPGQSRSSGCTLEGVEGGCARMGGRAQVHMQGSTRCGRTMAQWCREAAMRCGGAPTIAALELGVPQDRRASSKLPSILPGQQIAGTNGTKYKVHQTLLMGCHS